MTARRCLRRARLRFVAHRCAPQWAHAVHRVVTYAFRNANASRSHHARMVVFLPAGANVAVEKVCRLARHRLICAAECVECLRFAPLQGFVLTIWRSICNVGAQLLI